MSKINKKILYKTAHLTFKMHVGQKNVLFDYFCFRNDKYIYIFKILVGLIVINKSMGKYFQKLCNTLRSLKHILLFDVYR